jgi:hypothetical protein
LEENKSSYRGLLILIPMHTLIFSHYYKTKLNRRVVERHQT